jgi:hypothetical protein
MGDACTVMYAVLKPFPRSIMKNDRGLIMIPMFEFIFIPPFSVQGSYLSITFHRIRQLINARLALRVVLRDQRLRNLPPAATRSRKFRKRMPLARVNESLRDRAQYEVIALIKG